jgi:conjugative transposon TraN protein
MNYFKYSIPFCLLLSGFTTMAQIDSLRQSTAKDSLSNPFALPKLTTNSSPTLPLNQHNIKGSYRISVAYFKTSHIVFDSKIIYFDIGSKNVIGEIVDKVDNVLKLKAAFLEPFETNVTVITASGKYYSFIVIHNENPVKLNVIMEPITMDLGSAVDTDGKIIFTQSSGMDEAKFKDLSVFALKQKNIKHIRSTVGSIRMEVQNILSKEDNILITLKMKNNSYLNYEVELLKAYIRDSETNKRDLTQEVEIKPIFLYVTNLSKAKKKIGEAKGQYGLVLLFNKFAIAKNKTFDLDMIEKNGGRNFNLKIDFETFYYQMKQL